MPDYSAGGLFAGQAVLPMNIRHGSTSARMSHADAATETQGDCHRSIKQYQKPFPSVRGRCSHECSHLYWVRNGRLDHCPRCHDTRSVPEGLLAMRRIRTLAVNRRLFAKWWGTCKYQSGYQWRRRWPTESILGQRCSQPKPNRRVMPVNAPVLSPDPHP